MTDDAMPGNVPLSDLLGPDAATHWFEAGMDYAYTESTDPTCGDEWTSEDVARAFQAGALLAGRADRERSEKLAAAIVVAMQCIKAAYEDNWASFDALSDDFDDAVSAAMQGPNVI